MPYSNKEGMAEILSHVIGMYPKPIILDVGPGCGTHKPAQALTEKLSVLSNDIIVSITCQYKQGILEDNQYEEHKQDALTKVIMCQRNRWEI